MMRVVVLHNAVAAGAPPEERDVLVQADAVLAALSALGHTGEPLACTLDLDRLRRELTALRPAVVFNLVEALGGSDGLQHLVPALLEAGGWPYTGASGEAFVLTNHKVLAKERMAAAGLPTPPWHGPFPDRGMTLAGPPPEASPSPLRWIVKSLREHASFGLEADDLLLDPDPAALGAALRQRAPRLGGACFAEVFVEGREFNLALLAAADGVEVLPPAEITFEGLRPGQPRVVGYRAKWDADSYEYHHTPRHFEFSPTDAPLLARLSHLARRCWTVFGLAGYARVDFRVDHASQPWILEINTNPCLSPDAGFAAALEQAGIGYAQAVGRILADARRTGAGN
jgi:D-alanine-D-alanine ligase